jgi:hypothetical protein
MSAGPQVTPRHSISTVATALCFMLAVLAVAFSFEAWRQMRFDETTLVYEFEGYINYGSPFDPKAIEVFGTPSTTVLTESRIEEPVFHLHEWFGRWAYAATRVLKHPFKPLHERPHLVEWPLQSL